MITKKILLPFLLILTIQGFSQLPLIHGVVYYDANRNRIRDAEETIIPEQLLYLDVVYSPYEDAHGDIAATYENGIYEFFDIKPNSIYKVSFSGSYDSQNFQGETIQYVTTSNQGAYLDFAFQPKQNSGYSPAALTNGRVYFDNNKNNIFDSGDDPYPYAVIRTVGDPGTGIISNYTITTDENGQYNNLIAAGEVQVSLESPYDQDIYEYVNTVFKTYTSDVTDVIDFAIQKIDSVRFTVTYIDNDDGFPDPNTVYTGGVTRHLTLRYGYTGILPSMPAKVILKYDPKISLASSSIAPSLNTAGHLEWDFANVNSQPPGFGDFDSIKLSFNIPVVGDTISAFLFKPDFVPGIAFKDIGQKSNSGYYENFVFPDANPIGTTAGIKWLRTYAAVDYGYLRGIDTVQNSDSYYVLGTKAYEDGAGSFNNISFVSKINKDGLSVWEKKIDQYGEGLNGGSIKQTGDGGLIALINVFDSASDYFYALKLDSLGNQLWSKKFGDNGTSNASSVAATPDGGFIITGITSSHTGVFANNIKDSLNGNVFVLKLNAAGNVVFSKVYGGSREEYANRIIPLSNGSFLLLAYTNSNDGDVTGAHQHGAFEVYSNLDTLYNWEAWVINIDANGNKIWNKCYGGSGLSYFSGAAENAGGILLAGFTNSKDGDLPYYPEQGVPLWLLQISNTGNITSSRMHKMYRGYQDTAFIESTVDFFDNLFFSGLRKTKDGNFVIGGSISDKYGSIKTKHGNSDFVIVKFNPAGDIIWQKATGGTSYDELTDIVVDRNDDIVFTGTTSSVNDDIYGNEDEVSQLQVVCKIGITNIIKGQVFVDNNNNGIKDASELFYSNGRVQSAKIKDTVSGYIFSGQFLNNVDTGNYVTTYIPVNNYYTVSPASKNTSFTTLDQTDVVNFALKPKPNMNDLEVQLIPLNPARPGFESHYRIIAKNVGTTTINNTAVALKKDSRQTYVSSTKTLSGSSSDSLWWGPVILNAFDIDTVDVVLVNAVPPGLNNGDTLSLTATAYPIVNDSSAANNNMTVKQIVQGSFDPNDKTEIHGGQLTPLAYSNNEYLQYLIRFQNTGTDTAFFVTVKDTFDTKFDLSTVDVIAASHSYNFKIEKNVATWDFKFIKLVDSATNEPGSHGYIMFRVKPKKGLSVGDVFNNNAAIYFDYNLPVITNREKTFISDGNGICPGGNIKFTSSVSGSTYQWQVNTGSGYTNITNNATYSGATTSALQITAAPTSLYGYKYRCLVNGNTYSAESQLKFFVKWTGAVNTDWQNAANWNCGVVPDANTDVQIKAGVINYPVINNSVSCRSINAVAGVSLLVKSGVQLNITGKK